MAGGTKRRRTTKAGAKSSPSTSPTTKRQATAAASSSSSSKKKKVLATATTTTTNYIYKVQKELQQWTTTPARATAALQSLADISWIGSAAAAGATSSSSSPTAAVPSSSSSSPKRGTKKSSMNHPTSGTTSTTSPPCVGYWIIAATSIVARLVQELRANNHANNNHNNAAAASTRLVLVTLSETLSRLVTSDRSKLEKALQVPTSRTIVARAWLTPTMAAVQCLSPWYYHPDDDNDHNNDKKATKASSKTKGKKTTSKTKRGATAAAAASKDTTTTTAMDSSTNDDKHGFLVLTRAIATLDRMVHLQASTTLLEDLEQEHDQDVDDDKTTTTSSSEEDFQQACALLSTMVTEEAVVQCLERHGGTTTTTTTQGAATASPPSSTTRNRSRRTARMSTSTSKTFAAAAALTAATTATSTTAAAAMETKLMAELLPLMTDLLGPTLWEQRFDARVAVKRWSSMALIWYNQAPFRLLQVVHTLARMTTTTTPVGQSSQQQQQHRHHTPIIMQQLMDIVSEASVASGFRPPTGGMDQYLQSLGDKKKNDTRVDIRSATVVAIYDVLHTIYAAAAAAAKTTGDDRPILLLEEETAAEDSTKTISSSLSSSRRLVTLLPALCRAASLSVTGSSYSQQTEWTRTLLSLTVSFVLQLYRRQEATTVVVDVHLLQWALSHFNGILESTQEQPTIASVIPLATLLKDRESKIQDAFSLNTPLPEPILVESNKGATFAGFWTPGKTFTNEDALATMLRGLCCGDNANKQDVRQEAISFLTRIIQQSYDTRSNRGLEAESLVEDSKPKAKGGRKRAAAGRMSTDPKGKKRKTTTTTTRDTPPKATAAYPFLSKGRAGLATEALHALKVILTAQAPPKSLLLASMRDQMTLSQVKDLIGLGTLLDQVMIRSRLGLSTSLEDPSFSSVKRPTTRSTPAVNESPLLHVNEFPEHEKKLWSAHMVMCQVLGRGQSEHDGELRFPFTESERKDILEFMAGPGKKSWSLALPPAHCAFWIANITSMPPDPELCRPERQVADLFLAGILEQLTTINEMKAEQPQDPKSFFLEERPPLSDYDAALFILVFCRLPADLQETILDSLVKALTSRLGSLELSSEEQAAFVSNNAASGFLSRTIVLVCAMMSIQTYARPLRQVVFSKFGGLTLSIPHFSWGRRHFTRTRDFMGLLGDWESPALPDFDKTSPSTQRIKDKTLIEVQSLLEKAFRLGFGSARKDQGYLLFSAWNGLGKLQTEAGADKFAVSDTISLQISNGDYAKRILQMRDDIFMMQSEVQRISSGGLQKMSTARFRSNLKSTLHRANILMGRLLTDAMDQTDFDPSLLALLGALPSYVASSIAAHTKPGNPYFSTNLARTTIQRRSRAYSSESDRIHSDIESSVDDSEAVDHDESVADALSRLRDCCDAFGAAPTHPDWLDSGCTFKEGVSSSDAADNAETALFMLNKLARVSFEQYQRSMVEALKSLKGGTSSSTADDAQLCFDLLPLSFQVYSDDSPLGLGEYFNDRSWKGDVSELCNLPRGVLDLFEDESLVQNVDDGKEAWAQFSGQRLRGCLQTKRGTMGDGWEFSSAELRAGGEWDLLVAEALTLSGLDVKRYEGIDRSDLGLEGLQMTNAEDCSVELGQKHLRSAKMWQAIMRSAVNSMPPAASLLRMGICKVGRSPHPFNFMSNTSDPWDAAPLALAEDTPDSLSSFDHIGSRSNNALATLSSVAAYSDEAMSTVCHAVATQLVVDTKSFLDIENLQVTRLAMTALRRTIEQVGKVPNKTGQATGVYPFVVERLLCVMEDRGRNTISGNDYEPYGVLRNMFGLTQCSIKTLQAAPIKTSAILKFDEASRTTWIKSQEIEKTVGHLAVILCGSPIKATDKARAAAALLLDKLLTGEWDSESQQARNRLRNLLCRSIDALSKDYLKDVLIKDLIEVEATKGHVDFHVASLSRVLLFLVGAKQSFKGAKYIHDVLLDSLVSWGQQSPPIGTAETAIHVLLVLGCRFQTLPQIGSCILGISNEGADTGGSYRLSCAAAFFEFLQCLLDHFNKKSSLVVEESHQTTGSDEQPTQNQKVNFSRRCSFVEKTGYHGQHWYNCYTCGLVWEKGCCTLCALICHRGHDVTYSRYSSFFCDCAAEDGNSSSQSRVSCDCMAEISSDRFEEVKRDEVANINMRVQKCEPKNHDVETDSAEKSKYSSLSIEIVLTCFSEETFDGLMKFSSSVPQKRWFDSLVAMLHEESEEWKRSSKPGARLPSLKEQNASSSSFPSTRVTISSLRSLLRERSAKSLEIHYLHTEAFVPVRSAKGFQTKMSGDLSSNAQLLTRLARNEISRNSLVADSRGRMIIAETCSIAFCATIPATANRYASKSIDAVLARQQMCVLGKGTIPFNIVGMKLCQENERHLVVWGFSEACVVVIKRDWDGIESTVDLALDLEQSEIDPEYLIKCEFVPGSQTSVVVGYGRYVRVYDVVRHSIKRANAIVAFNLGFEAALKDIAFLALNDAGLSRARAQAEAKMYMLLENGRLHSIDLRINAEGRIDSPIGQPCELSGSISLPTSGVRQRSGSLVGEAGTNSKSFGEGSNITYLKQSRVLLYKCASSCVLALMLDSTGNVEGSFELMPHVLTSEMISGELDGYAIVGPFSHWAELGPCYNENGAFFRVACVGRSSRTNQPKIVCIEFNENDVFIREIAWSVSSAFALSLSLSFEGLCAFSLPVTGDNTRECERFGERTFICASTSSGALLFFGEKMVDLQSKDEKKIELLSFARGMDFQNTQPKFPLTIFEHLENVSECDDLHFFGEGAGCDSNELKSKLLRDRSSSFVCHRREGCTIAISLRDSSVVDSGKKAASTKTTAHDSNGMAGSRVIVALRVLVGSTPTNVPSKLVVQGRPVELRPRMKKWYSLPLTNEEIVFGARNGFITLGIGPPIESTSNSGVDAVEVYAKKRDNLGPWMKKGYFSSSLNPLKETIQKIPPTSPTMSSAGDSLRHDRLVLGANALTSFCELSPEAASAIDEEQRGRIQSIVEETAYTSDARISDAIGSLICRLEPNAGLRGSLYDESILRGWMRALLDVRKSLPEAPLSGIEGKSRWSSLRRFLSSCVAAVAQIARDRPMIYLRCTENLLEMNASAGSIALQVLRYVLEACRWSLPCSGLLEGPSGIISLCLIEAAIRLNTERGRHLAGFSDIRTLLEVSTSDQARMVCSALSGFCRRAGQSDEAEANLFVMLQGARLVAYQCDSCGLCPMKEVRYTCLEESFDIDLCQLCFTRAKDFAQTNRFDRTINISLDGRAIGATTKLTCADLKRMEAVPLEKMDVAQIDPSASAMQEEEDDLQKALRLSLGESIPESGSQDDRSESQAYHEFISFFFTGMLGLLAGLLRSGQRNSRLESVLGVCLDLIRDSTTTERRLERAQHFALEVTKGISYLLNKAQSKECSNPDECLWLIISCIRATQLLLFPKETDSALFLETFHAGEDSQAKTNPDVRCDTHQIPAVRRKSAKGKNKDRRFYVCGRPRGERCHFFKWADVVEPSTKTKVKVSVQLKSIVLESLWNKTSKEGIPLNILLCRYLEGEIFENEDTDDPFEKVGKEQDKSTTIADLPSRYSDSCRQRDIDDGVMCSREKLLDIFYDDSSSRESSSSARGFPLDLSGPGDAKRYLLETSLDLLALVADYKTPDIARWFSLLCEIENSPNLDESHGHATKVLRSLCGKKRSLFRSVRDHFSFGFQFQALFRNAAPILEAGLLVIERARVCSPDWAVSPKLDWMTLTCGGLIGCENLVSKNDFPEARVRSIEKILDGIWVTVKNGPESWRRFCGYSQLPPFHRDHKHSSPDHVFAEKMTEIPPIIVLFWIGCTLSGVNQLKAFRLVEVCLRRQDGTVPRPPREAEEQPSTQADHAMMLAISGSSSSAPEELLINPRNGLTLDDMVHFVQTFVLNGASGEIRKTCQAFASQISMQLSRSNRIALVQRLVSNKFLALGVYGKNGVEFICHLQTLVTDLQSSPNFEDIANLVLHTFICQMDAIKYGKSNGEWVVAEIASDGGVANTKKKFDLSACLHCIQIPPGIAQKDKRENTSTAANSSGKKSGSPRSPPRRVKEWHPEQVGVPLRQRLEPLRAGSASDEFNTFYTLKHRVAISDVYLNANDSRGRFVKEVNIYFSPHPAKDAAELKSDEYAPNWQKCARMVLPRGASRISTPLLRVVVAANLRIEYSSFYERPGGSKASDGSLLVHCPRCTRVVTNAHGVCGHCGEVAFQCRKCRHINYDRLDAFLCVECGYCASGSFSLEVNAAVASNAIAIVSDKECTRTMKILGAVNTLHDATKVALAQKLKALEEIRTARASSTNEAGPTNFTRNMELALQGFAPVVDSGKGTPNDSLLNRLERPGSLVKLAARPEALHADSRTASSSGTSDRTRSLLRLARQIRSESGVVLDRRRSGDLLIRHLGRGIAVENVDDERNLIGLLEGGGDILDSADSLSRAIASVRGSSRGDALASFGSPGNHAPAGGASGTINEGSAEAAITSSKVKRVSSKELLRECQRLHALMREAQHECHRLKVRLEAWEQLNEGRLVNEGRPISDEDDVIACHCSSCGPTVALHLLILWVRLLQASPQQVAVDADFVNMLLTDSCSIMSRTLSDYMRATVTEIATRSESGARLVLEQIQKRLVTTKDPVSAEILGKIMSVDGHFLSDDYSKLAMDVLSQR